MAASQAAGVGSAHSTEAGRPEVWESSWRRVMAPAGPVSHGRVGPMGSSSERVPSSTSESSTAVVVSIEVSASGTTVEPSTPSEPCDTTSSWSPRRALTTRRPSVRPAWPRRSSKRSSTNAQVTPGKVPSVVWSWSSVDDSEGSARPTPQAPTSSERGDRHRGDEQRRAAPACRRRGMAGPGATMAGSSERRRADIADEGTGVDSSDGHQEGDSPTTEVADGREVGVGPHPEPWPDDPRLDPVLLAEGDRRNVADRYRYWSNAAVVAELDTRRHPFHVAIENWQHDLNIGTVIRTANAFNAAGVHIVGRRRYNRRGAMVTDRYLHVHHHPEVADLLTWAAGEGLPIVAIDIVPGAVPLESAELPGALRAALRAGGTGAHRRGVRRRGHGLLDRPVRLDPVDQRGRGRRHRHAHLDPPARRAAAPDLLTPDPWLSSSLQW